MKLYKEGSVIKVKGYFRGIHITRLAIIKWISPNGNSTKVDIINFDTNLYCIDDEIVEVIKY
jgi:hypothetical protein